MSAKKVPGTTIPYADMNDSMFSLFRPMIQVTDGLSLRQVCTITGLESSTIQNWIKRGFVAHPVNKKYHARQLARILLISALRNCMKIDRIGELMTLINGDADDESDDIISEEQLYDYLCTITQTMSRRRILPEEADKLIEEITTNYTGPKENSRKRLTDALTVMIYAYEAGRLKQEAEKRFALLQQENGIR